jgi:hypothetical protein
MPLSVKKKLPLSSLLKKAFCSPFTCLRKRTREKQHHERASHDVAISHRGIADETQSLGEVVLAMYDLWCREWYIQNCEKENGLLEQEIESFLQQHPHLHGGRWAKPEQKEGREYIFYLFDVRFSLYDRLYELQYTQATLMRS